MEHISVESKKSYKHGFVLREEPLRRLVSEIQEQISKTSDIQPFTEYEVKFKNGSVAKTTEQELLFKEQNEGSNSIIRLKIKSTIPEEDNISLIEVHFVDIDEDQEQANPISHIIEGKSKDWVFVTSSILGERISKLSRFEIAGFEKRRHLWFRSITLVIVYLFMMIPLLSTPNPNSYIHGERLKYLSAMERDWMQHKIKDPTSVFINISKFDAKLLASQRASMFESAMGILYNRYLIVFTSVIAAVAFLYWAMVKLYPAYNFVWGGYIEIFNRKQKIVSFILWTMLVGAILGVIINLISNVIWDHL